MAIMVKFDNYKGENYKENNDKVFPVVSITRPFISKNRMCTRTMIPLSLAWAITIHKS